MWVETLSWTTARSQIVHSLGRLRGLGCTRWQQKRRSIPGAYCYARYDLVLFVWGSGPFLLPDEKVMMVLGEGRMRLLDCVRKGLELDDSRPTRDRKESLYIRRWSQGSKNRGNALLISSSPILYRDSQAKSTQPGVELESCPTRALPSSLTSHLRTTSLPPCIIFLSSLSLLLHTHSFAF